MFKVVYQVKYNGKVFQEEGDKVSSYKKALIESEKTMTRINESKNRMRIDKAKIILIDRIKCNFIELAYIEYVGSGLIDTFENKRYLQYINKN